MKDPTSNESEPDSLAIGTMVIAHQDEDLSYIFKQGGYCIADGAITIAVETQATKDEQDPDCAFITLERYPLKTPIAAGDIFQCKGGMADNVDGIFPRAYGYFTFHAEEISVYWTVRSVEADVLVFELEAEHDDVNYYDDRSKRTPTRGLFKLAPQPISELWIPYD
jgi:hypothetical protein